MTLCDCFYHYYDLALGIAILKPVQYIQRVPKILFGCLYLIKNVILPIFMYQMDFCPLKVILEACKYI